MTFFVIYLKNVCYSGLPCLFNIGDQAFHDKLQLPSYSHASQGKLLLANTKEDFSKFDKKAILTESIEALVDVMKSGKCFGDPSLLLPFTMLCFTDLKKYTFVYWCCFPSIHLSNKLCEEIKLSTISEENISVLENCTNSYFTESLFAIDTKTSCSIPFSELLARESTGDVLFVCADPSTDVKTIGWFCRNVINALIFSFGHKSDTIALICLRVLSQNGIFFILVICVTVFFYNVISDTVSRLEIDCHYRFFKM